MPNKPTVDLQDVYRYVLSWRRMIGRTPEGIRPAEKLQVKAFLTNLHPAVLQDRLRSESHAELIATAKATIAEAKNLVKMQLQLDAGKSKAGAKPPPAEKPTGKPGGGKPPHSRYHREGMGPGQFEHRRPDNHPNRHTGVPASASPAPSPMRGGSQAPAAAPAGGRGQPRLDYSRFNSTGDKVNRRTVTTGRDGMPRVSI